MNFSWKRVWGVLVRHLYNFRQNYDRSTDTFYWPLLDILSFGFLALALEKTNLVSQLYLPSLLTGTILWFVLWRGQNEISTSFLEELWSDNVGNLFGSPLSIFEYLVAVIILDIVKIFLMLIFTGSVAFFMFGVNILNVGSALILLVALLMFLGITIGIFFVSLFLRFGSRIQTLAWSGGTFILPFSGVYYPVSVFPDSMQWFIKLVPSSYIFESMRSILITGMVPWDMLIKCSFLTVFYFIVVVWFLHISFKKAKENGLSGLK